jgi:outer membrane protein assembly factor BamB
MASHDCTTPARIRRRLQSFFSAPILEFHTAHAEFLSEESTPEPAMSCTIRVCLSVFLAVLLAPHSVSAADSWPGWQGPNRDNISPDTGLLKKWPADGPPLKWKASKLGGGYSGIAVVDGKIYTMGQVGGAAGGYAPQPAPRPRAAAGAARGRGGNRPAQNRGGSAGDCMVLCLDEKTGEIIWKQKIGGGDPNCTPSVDRDRVYALDRNGEFACLDANDGKIIWHKSLTKDFHGHMMSIWGYSESPLIDGDRVVVTPGGEDAMMVALDKRTGATIWKGKAPANLGESGLDGAGYSSIVSSNGAGVKQYVQTVGRGLVSFRAEDGKFLWNYNRIANRTANIPTPVIKDDYVFASTGYGAGAALLELKKVGDSVSAHEVYFLPGNKVQNHHGGMVLLGDDIYMGNGHNNGFPLCLDWKTGKIAWNGGRGPGQGSAAVIEADGELYFRYQDGMMALIEATPDGYHLRSKFMLPTHNAESWPHPVIVDRCLYLRDQDNLLCYDIAKH